MLAIFLTQTQTMLGELALDALHAEARLPNTQTAVDESLITEIFLLAQPVEKLVNQRWEEVGGKITVGIRCLNMLFNGLGRWPGGGQSLRTAAGGWQRKRGRQPM